MNRNQHCTDDLPSFEIESDNSLSCTGDYVKVNFNDGRFSKKNNMPMPPYMPHPPQPKEEFRKQDFTTKSLCKACMPLPTYSPLLPKKPSVPEERAFDKSQHENVVVQNPICDHDESKIKINSSQKETQRTKIPTTNVLVTLKKKLAKFKPRRTQQPESTITNSARVEPRKCASLDHIIYPSVNSKELDELRSNSFETRSQSSDLQFSYNQFIQSLQVHLTHPQGEHRPEILIDIKCGNCHSQTQTAHDKSRKHLRLNQSTSYSDVSFPSVLSMSSTDLEQAYTGTIGRLSKHHMLASSGNSSINRASRYQKSSIGRSYSLNSSSNLLNAIIHQQSPDIYGGNNSNRSSRNHCLNNINNNYGCHFKSNTFHYGHDLEEDYDWPQENHQLYDSSQIIKV
eukprot:Awhi_evm1s15041